MRGSDKKKYGELAHDLSIQYAINIDQYPKTLHEAVDVLRKVKFKIENNNDKSNKHKNNNNGCGERDKSNETSFAKTHNHEKVLLL